MFAMEVISLEYTLQEFFDVTKSNQMGFFHMYKCTPGDQLSTSLAAYSCIHKLTPMRCIC